MAFTTPEIPADGSALSVVVDADDAVAADNRVVFPLPDRRRIRVVPQGDMALPVALKSLLAGLPEVTLDAPADGALPVIGIGPAGSDAEVVVEPADAKGELLPLATSGDALVRGLAFEDALCRVPADPPDVAPGGRPLLLVDGSPVAVLNAGADQLTVSAVLFDEEASAVRRTGSLVFWSRLLHRLAGWRDEPLTLSPLQASRMADAGGSALVLKADMNALAPRFAGPAARPADSGQVRVPLWQLLLSAALALMILEAVLNIRGKIS
jgi:hypothetical protein